MNPVLGMLTLVVVIAAWEIWSVLKDIRKALQVIAGDETALKVYEKTGVDYPGKLAAVAEKLDAVVGELDRIGGILGGMLASMPSPPREPEARSDWDKLRAQLGVKSPDAK